MIDYEIKLPPAVLCAVLAGAFLLAADRAQMPVRWEWLRSWFVVAGILLASLAAALALTWLLFVGAALLERYKLAWSSAELAKLGTISHMSESQLLYARQDVQGVGVTGDNGDLEWSYKTRWGEIPLSWIVVYLESEAFAQYPQLSPIRLFSENSQERIYREAFTKWMVSWHFLEQRPGQKFFWLADQATVLERLGLT